jgi:hypothetical protein
MEWVETRNELKDLERAMFKAQTELRYRAGLNDSWSEHPGIKNLIELANLLGIELSSWSDIEANICARALKDERSTERALAWQEHAKALNSLKEQEAIDEEFKTILQSTEVEALQEGGMLEFGPPAPGLWRLQIPQASVERLQLSTAKPANEEASI